MAPPSEVVLGVDLGTSYSVAAAFTEEGVVEVIPNGVGGRMTPSCVHFNEGNDQMLVGEVALRMAVGDPASTVRGVKSVLGIPYSFELARSSSIAVINSKDSDGINIRIGSSSFAPEEVAGSLLMELKKAAEASLKRDVKKAVVAVPSYFDVSQRCAVQHAALLAGLEVQQLVNETTAAAICFAHGCEGARKVVILDVGAGGGSVAVVQAEANTVKVLAHCSAKLPGGDAFDDKMVEFLTQAVKGWDSGVMVTDPRDVAMLRTQWERAKRELSDGEAVSIDVPFPSAKATFQRALQRSEFEDQCEEYFQRISIELSNTLKMAKVEPEDVDDVVLVGGSSRIPRLQQLVEEALGGKKPLCHAVNPNEAVAVGAALLAAGAVTLAEERLALHTTVRCGAKVFSWRPNQLLPVTMSSARLLGRFIEVQQGEHTNGRRTVFKRNISASASAIVEITQMGSFAFRKSDGTATYYQLNGCLSEKALQQLSLKIRGNDENEKEIQKSKAELEGILRKVLDWKITDNDTCYADAEDLKDFCRVKLDWPKESGQASQEDLERVRLEIEGRFTVLQDSVNAGREQAAEARQSLQRALQAALENESCETSSGKRFAQRAKEICDKKLKWMDANPTAIKEEYDHHCKELARELQLARDSFQDVAAEQERISARNALEERVNNLTAIYEENDDRSEAGETFRRQISALHKQQVEWLQRNDGASQLELRSQLQSLTERCMRAMEDYGALKRAARAERERVRRTALEKLQSIATTEVSADHEAREIALEHQERCIKKLDWLNRHPDATTKLCREILDEIQQGDELVELKRQDEVERRDLLKQVQTSVRGIREVYNSDREILSVCDSVDTWLESNVPGTGKLKIILTQISEAFSKYRRSLQLDQAAVEVRRQYKMITQNLLSELGHYPAIKLESENQTGATHAQDGSQTDINVILKRMLQQTQWASQQSETRRLVEAAEVRAVEALQLAQAAGCMALMLYKAVVAERERVSLCVRFVLDDGAPVEQVLLMRVADGPSPPKGPLSCARLLAWAFFRLCELAGVNWKDILLGVSVVGAGREGRAFKEELSKAYGGDHVLQVRQEVPILEDSAVRLSQRLVDAIQEDAAVSCNLSARYILGRFFDTVDSLKLIFASKGQLFELLESKIDCLKNGKDPWVTYEDAVGFLSDTAHIGIMKNALREVAATEPTKKKLAHVLREEIGGSTFQSCEATCNLIFKEISRLAVNLDIMILPEWRRNFINGSILRYYLQSLPAMIKRQIDTSVWGSFLEDQVTNLVDLCVDVMAGLLDAYLSDVRGRILFLEELYSLRERKHYQRASASLDFFSKEAVKEFDSFKQRFGDHVYSLQTMMSAIPREEFLASYPHLYGILLRALTAPLTPPAGSRCFDQLRLGGRSAQRFAALGCPDEVVQAVMVLTAHIGEPCDHCQPEHPAKVAPGQRCLETRL